VSLIGAIRAEFAKLLTTRIWWILLIILVGYVAFTAAIIAAAFGGLLPGGEEAGIPTEGLYEVVYTIATSVGYVFPVILGTLVVTGEYRHQTVTPTFLATPRRGTVLVAKLVVLFVAGAVYGVFALVGSVGAGAPMLALADSATGFDDPELWLLFGRSILAMALWAVVGVGVGTLIPGQIAAIVVLLAFTQFIEPILRTVAAFVDGLSGIGQFLPGAAGDALVGASIFSAFGGGGPSAEALEWWQGGLVLLAYAVATTVGGFFTTWRKDVT
jgi:ABC-2 type transport system permease protein